MIRSLGVIAVVLSAGLMAGCTNLSKRIAYDGQNFRTKVAKVDKQRDVFVVTVRDVSRSVDGARQAAYHEAVSFCVASYGSSDIVWDQNPLDKDIALRVVDNTVTFQGKCPQAV